MEFDTHFNYINFTNHFILLTFNSYNYNGDCKLGKYFQILSFEEPEFTAIIKYPELSLKIQIIILKSFPLKFEL